MGLYVPYSGDFRWQLHSHGSTRPALAYGTTVTASGTTNTKGSWANVVTTPTAHDSYLVVINVNGLALSATSRQALLDIGIDEAGGTSYTVKINDLYVTNAGPYTVNGGIWYVFPLRIPAGSTIGARVQCTIASVTCAVNIQLFGLPAHPEMIRVGSRVETIGAVTASSSGTAITPGSTSEGAWTSMGSLSNDAWWWQVGFGQNDGSTSAAGIHFDVSAGDASNKKFLLENLLFINTAAEQQGNLPTSFGCVANAKTSDTIYVRAQTSASNDTSPSTIIYALGG